jgi:hypothetical protein
MQDLSPRQEALYHAYEIIAESFGMFDQSSGADGAHYMTEDENPFAEEGLNCANCSFYEGGQACEIVEGQINPNGLCKLWVIKEELLLPMDKASYSPPESVQNAAKQALAWIADGKAGDGFTSVGRYRAETLAAGEAVSLDTIMRMKSYFARHEVDKQGRGWDSGSDGYPSAGRVAWAAWGGDAGRSWANSIASSVNKASFGGDRSAAAQYAARVRWGSRGGSTAPQQSAGASNGGTPTQITKEQVPAFIDGLLSGDGSENLTDFNVVGTSFFNQHRAGALSRKDMPQVPSTRKEEFLTDIGKKGLTYKHESVNPDSLKPTQRDINGKSSAEIMQRESSRGADAFSATPAKSIIVSSDGFVMDGHHRWAGAALLNLSGTPTNISIVRVNARQKELIGTMKAWSASKGIAPQGFSDHTYPSVGKMLAFHKACELALSTQKEHGDDINS